MGDWSDTRPIHPVHDVIAGRRPNSKLLLPNEFLNSPRYGKCSALIHVIDSNTGIQVSFFLDDFDNALNSSTQLDDQIKGDAAKFSLGYSDLLSLVARQAMSALEITVSKNSDGSFNSSDIMAFMKDMGNIGAGGYAHSSPRIKILIRRL